MALILNIETATKTCSVSLAEDGRILTTKELTEANFSHAEKLHPFITAVLTNANVKVTDLNAIAVSKGPGSYTGLRIGVSAAKGLCFANNIPLISVETLQSMANGITKNEGFIIPMIDARRMEVYSAVFDAGCSQIRDTKAEIITSDSFSEFLQKNKVHFLGSGANKCKEVINHKNAIFIDDFSMTAENMIHLSYTKFQNQEFEDVAYFEPYYLKDFIATVEKKK